MHSPEILLTNLVAGNLNAKARMCSLINEHSGILRI